MKALLTIAGVLLLFTAFRRFLPSKLAPSMGQPVTGNAADISPAYLLPSDERADIVEHARLTPVDKLSLGIMPDFIPPQMLQMV